MPAGKRNIRLCRCGGQSCASGLYGGGNHHFGMIPLLPDVFFKPMAVTIMFGLGFATVLTLIVVPVLYRLFHHIRLPDQQAQLKPNPAMS